MKRKKVTCSIGFWLLMAGLIYLDGPNLFFMVFAACILHETGHYISVILFGSNVKSLRLTMVGAEMEISHENSLSYARDALIAFAGPGVNLLTAFVAAKMGVQLFAGINLCFGILNLLPITPLDGGRILKNLLSYLWPYAAEKVIIVFSLLCSGALLGLGLAAWKGWGNLSLLCTAAWLVAGVLKVKK